MGHPLFFYSMLAIFLHNYIQSTMFVGDHVGWWYLNRLKDNLKE